MFYCHLYFKPTILVKVNVIVVDSALIWWVLCQALAYYWFIAALVDILYSHTYKVALDEYRFLVELYTVIT